MIFKYTYRTILKSIIQMYKIACTPGLCSGGWFTSDFLQQRYLQQAHCM
jgi:hypothetical protein